MSDYNTDYRNLQVVNIAKSDCSSESLYVDTDTGEVVTRLQDDKFPWKERKKATLLLADIYREGHLDGYADRALSCSTWLEYLATIDSSQRQLKAFNGCHLRLCPLCSARRAKIMARRLTKVLEKVIEDHPNSQLLFLTLTIKNVPGDQLRDGLDQLTRAWKKLIDRRPVKRAIKGWFRALEITRNRAQDTYHPHIHAVLVVEDSYFVRKNGLYLTHTKWVEMWRQCLQVDYNPLVGIQRTKGKAGKQGGAAVAAAVEAAKYATKSSDYISPALPKAEAARVAEVYTAALSRKRMTAMGGWIAETAAELSLDVEDDTDLVHDDDGNGLTIESAEMLEDYGWHFGVSDHVLVNRFPNPDYEG